MFEWLSDTPAGRLFVIASFIVFAYLILLAALFGVLALVARRVGPPDLYRIGPVVFRFRPVRIRIRLWQFMLAIVASGALVEMVILARHASYAYKNAEGHASEAASYSSRQDPNSLFNFVAFLTRSQSLPPSLMDYFRAKEHYHEQMSQKYFDAARHPWRTVSPDPPEPDMMASVRMFCPPAGFEFLDSVGVPGLNAKKLMFRVIPEMNGGIQLLIPESLLEELPPEKATEDLAWLIVQTGIGEELSSKLSHIEFARLEGADNAQPINGLAAYVAARDNGKAK